MLWTKAMEGGIPIVDMQHKELFRQADELLSGGDEKKVKETLLFLERYAVDHFATEERLQQHINYPRAAEHKRQHDDFTRDFLFLKAEFEQSGYSLVTQLKLNRKVVAWLKEHIMGADKEFAEYYTAAALSAS